MVEEILFVFCFDFSPGADGQNNAQELDDIFNDLLKVAQVFNLLPTLFKKIVFFIQIFYDSLKHWSLYRLSNVIRTGLLHSKILLNMACWWKSLRNTEFFLWRKSYMHIHNWPLQPFSQDYWPSFSHHLCCIC